MTRNTIPYPTNCGVKKALETKRKKLSKNLRVRISQERFATIISPVLIQRINNFKFKGMKW